MTGFGRTGKFFASNYLSEKADIICLSKGLTGGFMPLGVTSCSNFIHEAFVSDQKMKTFFHGHSYTANPLACAAALASLDLMEKQETWNSIESIAQSHKIFADKIRTHAMVHKASTLGTIFALEVKSTSTTEYLNPLSEKISAWFIKKGILLRPLGNILYLIPPYCISKTDIDYLYSNIEKFLDELK